MEIQQLIETAARIDAAMTAFLIENVPDDDLEYHLRQIIEDRRIQ